MAILKGNQSDDLTLKYLIEQNKGTGGVTEEELDAVKKDVDDVELAVEGIAVEVAGIKDDIGTTALPTTAQTLTGAIAEVAGSIKTCVEMKLLWTNDSPSSNFNAQDVDVDLSSYNKVFVVANYGTSNTLQLTSEVDVGANGVLEIIAGMNGSSPTINSREFSTTTAGLSFAVNYRRGVTSTGVSSTNNAYIIPIKIYGIKGIT